MDKDYYFSRFKDLIEFFKKFELDENESLAYIILSTKGPLKVSDLANLLNINRTKNYRILKKLQNLNIVNVIPGNPMSFETIPLDKLFSTLVQNMESNLAELKSKKTELFKKYENLLIKESAADTTPIRFRFIEGTDQIFSIFNNLILSAQKEIKMIVDKRNLFRIAVRPTIVYMFRKASVGTAVNIITEVNEKTRELSNDYKTLFNIRSFKSDTYPNFLITDHSDIFVFLEEGSVIDRASMSKELVGFWCNSRNFIVKMTGMFKNLWDQSDNI